MVSLALWGLCQYGWNTGEHVLIWSETVLWQTPCPDMHSDQVNLHRLLKHILLHNELIHNRFYVRRAMLNILMFQHFVLSAFSSALQVVMKYKVLNNMYFFPLRL